MKMNRSWKSEFLSGLIILASLGSAWYFYAHSADQVVTHWNFRGEPDGWTGRFWGNFLFPIMLIGLYGLFWILPYLDPKAEKYESFAKVYRLFQVTILAALFGVGFVAGLFNIGYDINIGKSISLIVGLLLIVLGNYMGKIKPNWFMGVRTPWTLSSEDVWTKTNRFGGLSLMVFGVCIIISPYLPEFYGIAIFVFGALFTGLGSMVYSYILYRRERK